MAGCDRWREVRHPGAAYDTVAREYHNLLPHDLASSCWDRAMLDVFAEELDGDTVVDIGCGPGRITVCLSSRGWTVQGVDLSPAMVAVARRAHPRLSFAVGSLTDLAGRRFVKFVDWACGAASAVRNVSRCWPVVVLRSRLVRPR